ncbi:MAG: PASTA domain-containing protein [Tannerella sp.]|jgi:beta-lactam-binding protein with PASTA domain|nr:PASTA domain-containing protein [Tannerella sp.]
MKQPEKKIWQQFVNMPILVHLGVMIVISILLVHVVLQGLQGYTRHNEAVIIPNVRGLLLSEAVPFFDNNGLRYTVVDSVYSREHAPGVIVEMVPTFGSKVKEGRIVFITVNASNVQKAAIPDVADLSYRQALALVQSKGFTSVEIKRIPGKYKDLTIGIELNGKQLSPGEQVPLSSGLLLVICDDVLNDDLDSTVHIHIEKPSTETVISETEDWF